MKTVGAIGAALFLAGVRGERTAAVILVAVGSAAGLAGVNVIYVSRGVIEWQGAGCLPILRWTI